MCMKCQWVTERLSERLAIGESRASADTFRRSLSFSILGGISAAEWGHCSRINTVSILWSVLIMDLSDLFAETTLLTEPGCPMANFTAIQSLLIDRLISAAPPAHYSNPFLEVYPTTRSISA